MTPQERARSLRARLMRPPNAVPDIGIDLKRIPLGVRYVERIQIPFIPTRPSKSRVEVVKSILTAVGDHFRVGILDLTGPGRHRNLANARHIAVHLLMTHTTLSSSAIGRILNRDHSTALSSKQVVLALLATDTGTQDMIKAIEAKL